MMVRVYAVLIASTLMLAMAPQTNRTLRPVDEGARDPALTAFRAQLAGAVRARNARALHNLIAPDIEITFGQPNGRAAFDERWHPERKDSRLWNELDTILRLGGAFVDQEFCAPYTYAAFPSDIDGFGRAVIVGENVPVRSAAAANAPVVGRISYEIVGVSPGMRADRTGWIEITRAGSPSKGYVERRSIRSPTDFRTCFAKRDGRWMMAAFIAGD